MAGALTQKGAGDNALATSNMPTVHGNERARMTGYGPEQVIQEYQIFRDCFVAVARLAGVVLGRRDWPITHHSIDAGICESIREFTAMHDSFQRRIAAGLSVKTSVLRRAGASACPSCKAWPKAMAAA